MPFLQNPIDIEEYIRIYRRENEMTADKKLVAFTQTKDGRYTATWQNDDFQNKLWGKVDKLRSWMIMKENVHQARLAEEAQRRQAY